MPGRPTPTDELGDSLASTIELLRGDEDHDGELQGPELADELGVSVSRVRSIISELRHKHGYRIHSKSGTERGYVLEEEFAEDRSDVLAALSDGGATKAELADILDEPKHHAGRVLDELRDKGHTIEHKVIDDRTGEKLYYIPDESDRPWQIGDGDGTYRFGLVSDTHLGSTHCHLRELHDFYDELQDRGITTVFHAGDITDGYQIHQGHVNVLEPAAIGWGRLKDYTVANYPERSGIDTLFVEGNHDRRYFTRNQIHFGQLIDNARPDLHYVGDCSARFIFKPDDDPHHEIDLELIHPRGGKPYTAGYRAQTLYRERPIEARPTVSALGHLHEKAWFDTHGVEVIYPACWKGVTTWGKRKGHSAKIGGWIIELTIRDGHLREVDPTFIKYPVRETESKYDMADVVGMTGTDPEVDL